MLKIISIRVSVDLNLDLCYRQLGRISDFRAFLTLAKSNVCCLKYNLGTGDCWHAHSANDAPGFVDPNRPHPMNTPSALNREDCIEDLQSFVCEKQEARCRRPPVPPDEAALLMADHRVL